MTPKRSARASAKKTRSPSKESAPKAASPMQQHNHVAGSNVDGMAAQARAAHQPPAESGSEVPRSVAETVAPMNTPLAPPAASATDEGQRS